MYVPVIFFLFFISSIIVLFSFSKTTSSRLLSFNDTLPNMYSLFSDIVSILISIGSISIYLSFFLSFNIIVYFLASSILIFFIEITPSSFSLPVIKSSNLIFSPVTSLIKSILFSFSSITSMSKIISFNACSFLASFFINFIFDFILLFTTKVLLKRNVKIKRIILGSFIGTFSIFILFISMPSFIFFLSKMFFGLIMVIITFKFKDIKYTLNNFFYLMILSIILGGFLYFLNIEAGYEHVGLIFYKTGKTLDIFILLLLSILFFIILYIFNLKYTKNKRYHINTVSLISNKIRRKHNMSK